MVVLVDLFEEYDLSLLLPLVEGKDLGDWSTDKIRQAILDSGYSLASDGFKNARKRFSKKAKVRFEQVSKTLQRMLMKEARSFVAGNMPYSRWISSAKRHLRKAYGEAFRLGYKSSGIGHVVGKAGPSANPHEPTKSDLEHLEDAVKTEVKYLARMMKTVRSGTLRGTLENRIAAYADALQHIYYAGRVAGTPKQFLIDWVSPLDRKTCKGCRFLAEHSPYTRDVLPTVPRSGSTPCLSRCRCRLVMREATKRALKAATRRLKSKAWYLKKLENQR